ncbi:MAG TPA: DUF2304 domain-containing protein [Candidatus Omnitrophota bacterium]|nr:DUF2304 domain-containing protein [Candidatus Omnitrophota bacterium]HPD85122.1 DUF2304 domain-containing protein [Candidatus Omnitrophota bacterium]HRZ03980.1 DUF2304 domain-containing protein [Candidatus Omnitrophota bacterium]
MDIKILSLILSLIIFVLVIELVRREKLTFKYAFGWLVLCVAAVFFAVFDQLLFKISGFLGFTLASNFIFFSLLCFFVFLSLLLTAFLCQQNNRNDMMAQKIGILEFEVSQLKKLLGKKEQLTEK